MTETLCERLVADANSAAHQSNPVRALAALLHGLVGGRAGAATLVRELPGRGEPETVLFKSDELTVLRVEIEPCVQYPPHDHRMPAVIGVLEASECNTYYMVNGPAITPTAEIESRAGAVIRMNRDIVHAVSNRGTARSSALHVYLGDLFGISRTIWHPLTGERFPYTEECYFALARRRGRHVVSSQPGGIAT